MENAPPPRRSSLLRTHCADHQHSTRHRGDLYLQVFFNPSLTVLATHHIQDNLRLNHTLSQEDRSVIFEQVRDLFTDSPVWPSCRTAYYLGLLPSFLPSSLGTRMHARITHIAHIISIQLAGRIWGEVRRHGFVSHVSYLHLPVFVPSIISYLAVTEC
jgi:hypothetical protein